MKTLTIGRKLVIAVGSFALLLLVPELASAQANALFPDIYIKRQRPCTSLEDPRYGYIREQYFGYFPTCWRKFPPGWGCPNAEAPNWEAELKRMPLDIPTDLAQPSTGAGEPLNRPDDPFTIPGREATPRPGQGELPALPQDEGPLFPRPGTNPTTPPTTPPDEPGAVPDTTSLPAPSASDGVMPPALSGAITPAPGPRFELEEAPALAPPSSILPGAAEPAPLPATSAREGDPTNPPHTHARRGVLSQWVGRMRRR